MPEFWSHFGEFQWFSAIRSYTTLRAKLELPPGTARHIGIGWAWRQRGSSLTCKLKKCQYRGILGDFCLKTDTFFQKKCRNSISLRDSPKVKDCLICLQSSLFALARLFCAQITFHQKSVSPACAATRLWIEDLSPTKYYLLSSQN